MHVTLENDGKRDNLPLNWRLDKRSYLYLKPMLGFLLQSHTETQA